MFAEKSRYQKKQIISDIFESIGYIEPGLYNKRAGKSKNGDYKHFNDLNKLTKQNDHMYILTFILPNSNSVALDYRYSGYVKTDEITGWEFIARVNPPMIIEISNTYATLHNRVGLISFPFDNFKLIEESSTPESK